MDEELIRRVASRYKKAKAEENSRTEVIESAYFHTGNGGLTLEVIHKWFPDTPDLNVYSMQASYNHMGSGVSCEFPLESMDIAGWLHEVTGRLLSRMAMSPDEARTIAFDYQDCGDVSVENGVPTDYKFRWDGQGKHLVKDEVATFKFP